MRLKVPAGFYTVYTFMLFILFILLFCLCCLCWRYFPECSWSL